MAFLFDSRLAVCALALFTAAAFAWTLAPRTRVSVRLNLRFAAMLFAAWAAASFAAALMPDFAPAAFAVAVLVVSLASAALGLSVFGYLSRRPPSLVACMVLGAGLGFGLAACLSGQTVLALVPVLLSASVMLALGLGGLANSPLKAVETILGASMLIGGGMALMQNAAGPSLLFFAAALVGLASASQTRVEQQAGAGLIRPIGGPRF